MSIMEELGINVRPPETGHLTREEREARRQRQRNRWVGDGRADRRSAAGDRIKPTHGISVEEARQAMLNAGEAPCGQKDHDKSFISHSGSKGRRRPDPEPITEEEPPQ